MTVTLNGKLAREKCSCSCSLPEEIAAMYAHILMIPSNYESIETGEELYVNIILCWMEYYFSSAYSPENTFLLPTYYILSLRKRNTKLELDISNNTGLTGLKIRQCFLVVIPSGTAYKSSLLCLCSAKKR